MAISPSQPQFPLPLLARMMVFIDGENLVARYQVMLDGGYTPYDTNAWEEDVFVWQPASVQSGLHIVLRATYYTYAVGSEEVIAQQSDRIRSLTFQNYNAPGDIASSVLINTLSPRVFLKMKNRSGKGVGIQMTVDILTHVYQNNLDAMYLISGDADYKPVIQEVQRMGKQVFIAALSSGLSPELRLLADHFVNLDGLYFHPRPQTPAMI